MDVVEDPEGLRVVLERDAALIERETAGAWLDAFVRLLERAPELAQRDPRSIELVGEQARRSLTALGDGGGPPARRALLHDELRTALVHRDRIALVHGARSVSYGALWSRACGLAQRLVRLEGAAPRLVAVRVTDPIDAIVSVLGALLSGAAYVPVDPALPAARAARMLEDARPFACITDTPRRTTGAIPSIHPRGVDAEVPPSTDLDSSAPAYVVFTSGSTGRPKGVVVAHANVVHQLDARRALYRTAPGRVLVAHSLAFDAAVGGVFWALADGGTLVLAGDDERRDPEQLRAIVERERVELVDLPPALYAELLGGGAAGLSSLRIVIVGGEALPPALARLHRSMMPGVRLVNEYGPTETTVFSTAHVVDSDPEDSVPLGRPIHRTRCRIVNEEGRLALRGAIGELWIGGAGVAQGYLGQDDRTRERFVTFEGERMYRTGDRARWAASGVLSFHGRTDAQVQVRGHRVELAEIVLALEKLPGVAQAAVVARDRGGTSLDAYVVPRGAGPPDMLSLRERLRADLPEVMVPSTITPLTALPRSGSGKIDHASLPPPSLDPAPGRERWRNEPRTQAEEHVAEGFRRILGIERFSVHDSFFDLGGTSVSAVRVLALLQRELALHVSLAAFMRSPSVAGLAALLHDEGLLAEEELVVKIQPGDGTRAPFWLVHPVGGHVVFAHRIARRWRPEQALYGIQARGLDGRHPPIDSMDAMASLYVELIRSEQPAGPYLLGGPSQGGLVALEIAQRLLREGEEVALLVMFDCWAPGWPRKVGPLLRALDHVRALRDLDWPARTSYVGERVRRRLGGESPAWMRYDHLAAVEHGAVRDAILDVQRANARAADAYVPRSYPGRIHVFGAAHLPRAPGYRFDDTGCGWAPHARGGVVTQRIDAAHHDMLDEPGVAQVARELERLLDEAHARA